MSEPAVHVRGLWKSYGEVDAVRGVDLSIRRGEVFALLGPNGAGKTTTVEILEGHRGRDAGEVRVLGHDPADAGRELKRRVGIVLQSTGIEPYLTVEEVVEQFRGFYPRPLPLEEVLEATGLADLRRQRVRRLSGGLQRRLDVAVGLAGDPDLLFLDEPTTGFDPAARRGAWEMIRNLRSLGKTVLLTTHYMDEAQALADRVAVIVRGRIVAEGPPRILASRDPATTITFHRPGESLPDLPEAEVVADADHEVTLRTERPTRVLHELTRWALERGLELEGLSVSRPTLEDVYLELTREEA